jgi:uncharacterized protein YoxC
MAKEKNIFETASGMFAKKNKSSHSKSSTVKVVPQGRTLDKETLEMLDKIQFMQKDLKAKMDYIEQQSAVLKKQKLSPEELKYIENSKELLENKIWSAIGKSSTQVEEANQNNTLKRKAKTLGARKKWLPMR